MKEKLISILIDIVIVAAFLNLLIWIADA